MIRTRNLLAAFFGFVLASGALLIYALLRPPEPKPGYPDQRQIQYSFTLQNRTNQVLEKAGFWVAAPAKQTSTQVCNRIEASHPYDLLTDASGNQTLYFNFKNLPPFATRLITVHAHLALSDVPNRVPVPSMEPFLRPEPYCESDAQEIVHLASTLRAGTPAQTAERIYAWISTNVQYTGYRREAFGALWAFQHRKGDCTEFMHLFVALCRAAGIPARSLGGYVKVENAVVRPNDFHNWAEFHDGKLWRIADPQRKVFMKNASHYVVTRILGGAVDDTVAGFHRFRYAGRGLRVRMDG